jgi:hypothetical protein
VKRAAFLLPVFLIAACASTGPAPVPTNQITASFPPGSVANQIEIMAIDRLPLRGAELVAPDGQTTPALSIAANPARSETFSQQFAGGVGSGPGYGLNSIAPSAATPNIVGAATTTQTTLLAIVSTASIQLPDPASYRRNWQHYRVRLTLGTAPEVETREIAAPAPPASS